MSLIFVTIWTLGLFAIAIGTSRHIRNRWLSLAACIGGLLVWNAAAYAVCYLLASKP